MTKPLHSPAGPTPRCCSTMTPMSFDHRTGSSIRAWRQDLPSLRRRRSRWPYSNSPARPYRIPFLFRCSTKSLPNLPTANWNRPPRCPILHRRPIHPTVRLRRPLHRRRHPGRHVHRASRAVAAPAVRRTAPPKSIPTTAPCDPGRPSRSSPSPATRVRPDRRRCARRPSTAARHSRRYRPRQPLPPPPIQSPGGADVPAAPAAPPAASAARVRRARLGGDQEGKRCSFVTALIYRLQS